MCTDFHDLVGCINEKMTAKVCIPLRRRAISLPYSLFGQTFFVVFMGIKRVEKCRVFGRCAKLPRWLD